MKINKETRDLLLEIQKTKRITLEGNILKLIEADPGDDDFSNYIKEAIEKDKDTRRRRLDITKQIQEQNKDLLSAQEENNRINEELHVALESAEDAKREAEDAKNEAINDLDIIQK
jgi:hypothetical protein